VTIVSRRRIYWSLFFVAASCLAAFVLLYIPVARGRLSPEILARSGALSSFSIFGLKIPSHQLSAAGIGLSALFSILTLAYILASFRKTVSSEIFFFSFWALSLALEVIRLVIFTLGARGDPISLQVFASKALLFARFFGFFSLFASGLYASGFRQEKHGTILASIFIVAVGLSSSMPVNTGVFAPTLELKAGYGSLMEAIWIIVGLITVVNFLYAVRFTGEGSYRLVAIGCAAFLAGQRLLEYQWNPLYMLLGFALLAAGSWVFVARLHAYYLWQ
jgi:hypothetical protein